MKKVQNRKATVILTALGLSLSVTALGLVRLILTPENPLLPLFSLALGGAGMMASVYGTYSHYQMARLNRF